MQSYFMPKKILCMMIMGFLKGTQRFILKLVNNAGSTTLDLHLQISALKGTIVNKTKALLWGDMPRLRNPIVFILRV